MYKKIKVWKKQEKRIVKLLYKKGLLERYNFPLKEFYWENYKKYKKPNRKNKNGYKWMKYFPEVYFSVVDYWGEVDEYSLIDNILNEFYWKYAKESPEDCDGVWPKSDFNYKGRKWFIEYLKKLPTVKNDSGINKVLNFRYNQ